MGTRARPDASTRSSLNLEFCEISNRVSHMSGIRDYALQIRRNFTESGDWRAIEAGGKEWIRLRPNSGCVRRVWCPLSQRRIVRQNRENRAHRTAALAFGMLAFVVVALFLCRTPAMTGRADINRGLDKRGATLGNNECSLF